MASHFQAVAESSLRELIAAEREEHLLSVGVLQDRIAELEALIATGLLLDGEPIPLLEEGGVVDRAVGIDEPNYLTVADEHLPRLIKAAQATLAYVAPQEAA